MLLWRLCEGVGGFEEGAAAFSKIIAAHSFFFLPPSLLDRALLLYCEFLPHAADREFHTATLGLLVVSFTILGDSGVFRGAVIGRVHHVKWDHERECKILLCTLELWSAKTQRNLSRRKASKGCSTDIFEKAFRTPS